MPLVFRAFQILYKIYNIFIILLSTSNNSQQKKSDDYNDRFQK